jgi:hypothetical protein
MFHTHAQATAQLASYCTPVDVGIMVGSPAAPSLKPAALPDIGLNILRWALALKTLVATVRWALSSKKAA